MCQNLSLSKSTQSVSLSVTGYSGPLYGEKKERRTETFLPLRLATF